MISLALVWCPAEISVKAEIFYELINPPNEVQDRIAYNDDELVFLFKLILSFQTFFIFQSESFNQYL